jgi:hypothetical protein
LTDNIIYNGQLAVPVLTMHTTADGLVPVEDERAYAKVANEAMDGGMLRRTFVHRAGHCEFSPAEMIVAMETLQVRLATGKWKNLSVAGLNAEAAALGPEFNIIDDNGTVVPAAPAFLDYQPLQFLRLYDTFTQ